MEQGDGDPPRRSRRRPSKAQGCGPPSSNFCVAGSAWEKLAQRIAEGLDATEIKFFQHEGKVIQTVEVVDWEQRRKYIELAVKYAGYYVDKREVEAEQKPMETWTQQPQPRARSSLSRAPCCAIRAAMISGSRRP